MSELISNYNKWRRSQSQSCVIPDGQKRKICIQLLQLQQRNEGAVRDSHRHGEDREDSLGIENEENSIMHMPKKQNTNKALRKASCHVLRVFTVQADG